MNAASAILAGENSCPAPAGNPSRLVHEGGSPELLRAAFLLAISICLVCPLRTLATSVMGRVEMWRSGCRPNISVAAPFVWRCLTGSTVALFPHPAHRTGRADFRIRLLDKTSRLRPRLAAPTRGQAYETVMPVEVREWICPAPASPDLVLEAQPPAQPHGCIVVERPIRFGD